MKMHKLIHGIYFRVRHFISRLGPWTYGSVGSKKARKHRIFGMVEICVDRDYYFPYHLTFSDWQEIPPFYWSEFKANK